MRTRVFALLAGLLVVVSATPAHAVAEVQRLAGTNRYKTAAAVNCCNADGSPRNFSSVVLASGLHFTDALAGNYLAGLDNGILLLTDGESLDSDAVDLIANADEASISNVYIIGGTDAVGQGAVDDLSDALASSSNGGAITRIAGEEAIETAVDVARLRAAEIGSLDGGGPWAIVATVGTFADSLAAAPLAYSAKIPVFYTNTDDLPASTELALDEIGFTQVIIVGGTAAVSNEVSSAISDLGIAVQRVAGTTRQETSVSMAEFSLSQDPDFDGLAFAIARGDHFADALAGGPHAGFLGMPILLSQSSTQLGFAAAGFLQRQSGTLETGWAYGGTGALAESVLTEAEEASDGP